MTKDSRLRGENHDWEVDEQLFIADLKRKAGSMGGIYKVALTHILASETPSAKLEPRSDFELKSDLELFIADLKRKAANTLLDARKEESDQ